MDPYASPPSPPPPPPPVPPARSEKVREEEDDGGWKVESIFISAKEMLGWCTEQYKSLGHKGVPPYLMVGGVIVVGFAALGLAVALPTRSRAVLVNFWGFLLPAVATIDEMDTTVYHRNKPPSGFTGYWVSSPIVDHMQTRPQQIVDYEVYCRDLSEVHTCMYVEEFACRPPTIGYQDRKLIVQSSA